MILDLTVPGGMGGEEAIRELRRIDPDVRAIVASGYSNAPVIAHASDYGFHAVLTKPFDRENIIEALHEVLPASDGVERPRGCRGACRLPDPARPGVALP